MVTIIMAQVKQEQQNSVYRRILSTEKYVFTIPEEISDSIPYSSKTLGEDNEWFKLGNFSHKKFYPELLKKEFSSADYGQITDEEFKKINFLYVYRNGNYFFQGITPSKHVKKKGIRLIGDGYEYVEDQELMITPYPHAIYTKKDDTLYFQRLASITKIFDGIVELYGEATQEKVEEFFNLTNDLVTYSSDFSAKDVKTNNRKRITHVLEDFSRFSPQDKDKIIEYAKKYCPKIVQENGIFLISTDTDLKEILYAIDQRYYETVVGGEKRLANSIIKID